MKNLFWSVLLIAASLCLRQTTYANANISIDGCDIVGSTTLSGYISGCTFNSFAPNYPYAFALQRQTGSGWTMVGFSGYIPNQSYSWSYPGPGTYRVISRVWRQTGNVIRPKGGGFPCLEIAEFQFISDPMTVNNLKQWVAYPLGSGDNSDHDIAVRNNNPENRVYFHSHDKMFEYVWGGTSWAKTELVPGINNVRGPIYAEPGATTNLFYFNKNLRMSRFTRNALGVWSNITLPGSYPAAYGYGQITAGPEGVIYTGGAEGVGKLYLIELQADGVTFDEFDIEVDNASKGAPTPFLVRMPNGVIVYRRDNKELVAARPFSSPRYVFGGNSAVFNVEEANIATDGTNVFYMGDDNQIWVWTMTGTMFNSAATQLGTLGNVAGDVAASTDRPGEVFYRGTDDRMWRITMTASGVIEEPLATNTNVKGATVSKQKIVYRDFNNNIWHQYETSCSYKTSSPSLEVPMSREALEITAYPNPARDQVTIQLEAFEDITGGLQLYDMTGRMVRELSSKKEFYAGSYEMELSVDDLPRGTYLLRWQGERSVKTQRVVLQ